MEIALGIIVVAFVALLVRTFRIVPQARVGVIQRLGTYQRSAESGLTVVVPFMDKMLPLIDMREQVVGLQPQAVITSDNVTINVTIVIYYQILDPKKATYCIANLLTAMEQIAQTTLRNVMGSLTLDTSLTSRDEVNARLRIVLDEVTEQWGVRVNRVELKDISPPKDIQLAMEKQMQAERTKRATILTAEGDAQAAVLRAEGEAKALITVQQAQAEAVRLVFEAVNSSGATPEAMQFQYLQMLPKLAVNPANKIIVVPADMAGLAGLATSLAQVANADSARTPAQLREGTDGAGRGVPQLSAGTPGR